MYVKLNKSDTGNEYLELHSYVEIFPNIQYNLIYWLFKHLLSLSKVPSSHVSSALLSCLISHKCYPDNRPSHTHTSQRQIPSIIKKNPENQNLSTKHPMTSLIKMIAPLLIDLPELD